MKKAFTLAEVLVTLMIIGVIAAMTIPGLKRSAEMAEYVAGCKKAYSTITQAQTRAELMHGSSKRWSMADENTEKVWGYFKENLNVVKDCINAEGCLGDGVYYQLDGTRYANITNRGYGSPQTSFQLADGSIGIFDVNPGGYYIFIMDVNGLKKPNKLGLDTFMFIDNRDGNGLLPYGYNMGGNGDCTSDGAGTECAARVLKESAIKY